MCKEKRAFKYSHAEWTAVSAPDSGFHRIEIKKTLFALIILLLNFFYSQVSIFFFFCWPILCARLVGINGHCHILNCDSKPGIAGGVWIR